jgi:transposase InsO family protein
MERFDRAGFSSLHPASTANSYKTSDEFCAKRDHQRPSAYLFDSVSQVREITDDWLHRYNEIRPHDALGSLPPARYRERLLATQNSTLELST